VESRFAEAEAVLAMIRPAMEADGGGVETVGIEGGVVFVRFRGMCLGCPSQNLTLKRGIERTLKERLPWVTCVVRVP
jgi:Fe-S cluster biogenesis protein NfuA